MGILQWELYLVLSDFGTINLTPTSHARIMIQEAETNVTKTNNNCMSKWYIKHLDVLRQMESKNARNRGGGGRSLIRTFREVCEG